MLEKRTMHFKIPF